MENFKYQLSVKLGNDLLNLRAETPEEFSAQLKWAVENAEQLQIACTALQKPEPVRPAATPRPAPIAPQEGAGREIGPIQLEGVEIKKGPRDGPPWKSPMYVVKWDGSSASTFDGLNGKAAMGFWTQGNPCFLTVEPSPKNPKFQNLLSIRMAAG